MSKNPEGRIERLPIAEAQKIAEECGLPPAMTALSVFQVILKSPKSAKALNDLVSVLLWKSPLDAEIRELIIMRLGWETGSVYEWTQHWRVAKGIGMSEEKILAARDWESSDLLSEAEKAALAATDDVIDTGAVGDEAWARCAEHLEGGETALIDLVVAIGNWRMFSSILRSLKIPLEDGNAPWPPDGEVPSAGSEN